MIEVIDENSVKINDIEDFSDGSNIVMNKNNLRNNAMFKIPQIYNANKKSKTYFVNDKEKDFIKVRKINPINNPEIPITLYKKEKEKMKKTEKKLYNLTSLFTLIKREHTYLRADYQSYIDKIHPNFFATILAEILDKIYFLKKIRNYLDSFKFIFILSYFIT